MKTATIDNQLADWRDKALKLESEVKKVIIGQDRAIKLMSIAIFARGHVLLEGGVGVGKTTLLKMLALLETPDSGHVHVDGLSYDFPLKKNAQIKPPWPKVTVVFQQLFLWPHLTLLQNMTLNKGIVFYSKRNKNR